jgi:hypothetical protein
MKNHFLALLLPRTTARRSGRLETKAKPTGGAELFISTNDFAVLYLPARWMLLSFFLLPLSLLSFSAPFIHHLDLVLSNKTNDEQGGKQALSFHAMRDNKSPGEHPLSTLTR